MHIYQWWIHFAQHYQKADAEPLSLAELGNWCCRVVLCPRSGGGPLLLPPCVLQEFLAVFQKPVAESEPYPTENPPWLLLCSCPAEANPPLWCDSLLACSFEFSMVLLHAL